jgi:hypothetical protein
MNERIIEMAIEAGFNPVNCTGSNVPLFEKFAELIVQECADYFGREGDRRFEVDGNWIAKTIKQHFGVED